MKKIIVFWFIMMLINFNAFSQLSSIWEVTESINSTAHSNSNKNVILSNGNSIIVKFGSQSSYKKLWVSTNKGITWEVKKSFQFPYTIYDMYYTGDSTIFLLVNYQEFDGNVPRPKTGTIYKSTDLGNSWEAYDFPDGYYLDRISMADKYNGIVYVKNSIFTKNEDYLLYTKDGWIEDFNKIDVPLDCYIHTLLNMTPGKFIIYFIYHNKYNTIYKTVDYGKNWSIAENSPPEGIIQMRFINDSVAWAVGGQYTGIGDQRTDLITKSTDGGNNWQIVINELVNHKMGLDYFSFADSRHGFAIGKTTKIYYTDDGGQSWVRHDLPYKDIWLSATPNIIYPMSNYAVMVGTPNIYRFSGEFTLKSPEFTTPVYDTSDIIESLLVKWTEIAGASLYDIQVSNSPTFIDILETKNNLSSNSILVNFDYNSLYYLRIKAKNSEQESLWSYPFIKVRTLEYPRALNSTYFTYPSNLSENVELNPLLKWNAVENATRYHIQISEKPFFPGVELIFDNDQILGTTCQLENLKENQYYSARIRALNDTVNSLWNTQVGHGLNFTTGNFSIVSDFLYNEFSLYPNPLSFFQSLKVSCFIDNNSNIKIALFNNLGIKVAEIFNGWQNTGKHILQFTPETELSAGTYWLRMTINNQETIVKPVVIIK